MRLPTILLVLLLLLAPIASAAEFEERIQASDLTAGEGATLLTGKLEATLIADGHADQFNGASDFLVSGVTQVCSRNNPSSCQSQPGVTYEIQVSDGADVAVYNPNRWTREISASHAIATFGALDMGSGADVPVEQGLVGSFFEGRVSFGVVGNIPDWNGQDELDAGIVSVQQGDPPTIRTYVNGEQTGERIGANDLVISGANIRFAPIQFQAGYVEAQAGSEIDVTRATATDAEDHVEGLDSFSVAGESIDFPVEELDRLPIQVLQGSFVHIPSGVTFDTLGDLLRTSTFATIEEVTLTTTDGGGEVTGIGGLVVREQEVLGANIFLAFALGGILFAIAIGSFFLRFVPAWEKPSRPIWALAISFVVLILAALVFDAAWHRIIGGHFWNPIELSLGGVPLGFLIQLGCFIGFLSLFAAPVGLILLNVSGFLPYPWLRGVVRALPAILVAPLSGLYILSLVQLVVRAAGAS